MSITHREETLRTTDGFSIYTQQWQPEQPTGVMVVVHGAYEHSGCYEHVARHYAERGLHVFALDHYGHGRSEGERAHLDRFSRYTVGLKALVAQARAAAGSLPLVMLGHSMGGLASLTYALEHPEGISALILSSPFLEHKGLPPLLRKLIPLMGTLAARRRIPIKRSLGSSVCKDPEIAARKQTDEHMCTSFTYGWVYQCGRQHAWVGANAQRLEMPLLMLQAGDDTLVSIPVNRATFEQVRSADKTFKLYPGFYHEILNDTGRAEAFADIDAWLQERGWVARA